MGWREDNADINEKIYRIRMQGMVLRMRMERRELEERSFRTWLMWERYRMELRRERLEMRSPESGKTQPRNNKGQYKKYKTDGSGNGENADDSTGLTRAENGDRIKSDRVFHTKYDPMLEVMGPAESSHPEEVERLIEHIRSLGARLIRPDHEDLNYQPGLQKGQPGQVVISKGASYSAWLHETKHLDDDFADGYLGMRVFADKNKCIQREIDAYDIEIRMAKEAGREDIAKRLEELRDNEIKQYC